MSDRKALAREIAAHTEPRFIEPQLATLVDQPPVGENWIHEVKHDGYRTLLVIKRDEARAGGSLSG
jgi:ATP-dependent DNA ligase